MKQGEVSGNLVALSRLLTMSQPAEHLVSTALLVAARLLPQDWVLYLFESLDSGTSLREISASNGHRVSQRQDLRTTLGFGEAIDRQVLSERVPVRTEQLVCIPLIDATGALAGALAAMRGAETTGSHTEVDDAVLEVIGAHLTTLLARAAEERLSRSSALVLEALPGLALPLEAQPLARENRAGRDAAILDASYAGREQLLTNAAVALDKVVAAAGYAESVLAMAFTRMRSGEWRLLRAGLPEEEAAPVFSDEVMSSITRLASRSSRGTIEPLSVGPANNPDLWEALAPLRTRVARHTGNEVAHLTLLPIIDAGQQVTAWLCMAGSVAANAGMGQLNLLATSIAVATTAGVRNLQLAETARAEGRARDAFISLTAHELRSPLTSIKGYAQLLLRQEKKHPIPEPMLRSVESIEQQSGRMAEMVGELLDASRITRGVLEVQVAPVDLVPLAQKVVERRAVQFPQHTITFATEEESVVAFADAQRVEQVLRDLIDNSGHHMPNGGDVTVALSRQDGMALFTVRDQGIGIPEGERERIFEYLYRSSLSEYKNLSGLGLGLYVSRHLVERFGGRLWLESSRTAEPTGSEFQFTLPLAKPSMDNTQQHQHA
ncbi:MAG TPA: HAMP domain-containing sensor histidine kinase [Ktedonobacterales bacterium]